MKPISCFMAVNSILSANHVISNAELNIYLVDTTDRLINEKVCIEKRYQPGTFRSSLSFDPGEHITKRS